MRCPRCTTRCAADAAHWYCRTTRCPWFDELIGVSGPDAAKNQIRIWAGFGPLDDAAHDRERWPFSIGRRGEGEGTGG